MARPQVQHGAERNLFDAEAGLCEPRGDQRLATGIVRRHRLPRDQVHRQRQHVTHLPTPNFFLKPLSVKPTLTSPSITTTGRLTSAGYSLISSVHSGSEPGALRDSGKVRQVVEARLISLSQPPRFVAHAFSVSAGIRCAR